MTGREIAIVRLCFIGVILSGASFIVAGATLNVLVPYAQLDVVLSPEQLRDAELRAFTLALLQKASGRQWLLWILGGVVQLVLGCLGLQSSRSKRPTTDPGRGRP